MSLPTWRLAPFGALTPAELYAALELRQRVFVIEQSCVFAEIDGLDDRAWHLFGWVRDAAGAPLLGAYARLFAPGIMYAEASIGRVATHPAVRAHGFGRALMRESLREVARLAPGAPVRIGAQRYLTHFYESFGFRVAGADYLEDGIPHVEMRREGDASEGD